MRVPRISLSQGTLAGEISLMGWGAKLVMVPPELTCADRGSIAPVILHRKPYSDTQQGGSLKVTVIVSDPQLQARWYGTAQFRYSYFRTGRLIHPRRCRRVRGPVAPASKCLGSSTHDAYILGQP